MPNHVWHSWSSERRNDHINKFKTTTSDGTYQDPKNAGRKPSYRQRQRHTQEPSLHVDRLSKLNAEPEAGSILATSDDNLAFADSRQHKETGFQLH